MANPPRVAAGGRLQEIVAPSTRPPTSVSDTPHPRSGGTILRADVSTGSGDEGGQGRLRVASGSALMVAAEAGPRGWERPRTGGRTRKGETDDRDAAVSERSTAHHRRNDPTRCQQHGERDESGRRQRGLAAAPGGRRHPRCSPAPASRPTAPPSRPAAPRKAGPRTTDAGGPPRLTDRAGSRRTPSRASCSACSPWRSWRGWWPRCSPHRCSSRRPVGQACWRSPASVPGTAP